MKKIVSSETDMLELGREFAGKLLDGRGTDSVVVELVGDVGAGKTTFVKGLANGLGVVGTVTSPSFTINKRYKLADGRVLSHYDFYRLADAGIMAEELEEALASGDIVVIEWADSVARVLPDGRVKILIKALANGEREVEISE